MNEGLRTIRIVILVCYLAALAAVLVGHYTEQRWALGFAMAIGAFGGIIHVAEIAFDPRRDDD